LINYDYLWFNGVCKSDYAESNDRIMGTNELEGLWVKSVMALFRVMSINLPGVTEKKYEIY